MTENENFTPQRIHHDDPMNIRKVTDWSNGAYERPCGCGFDGDHTYTQCLERFLD